MSPGQQDALSRQPADDGRAWQEAAMLLGDDGALLQLEDAYHAWSAAMSPGQQDRAVLLSAGRYRAWWERLGPERRAIVSQQHGAFLQDRHRARREAENQRRADACPSWREAPVNEGAGAPASQFAGNRRAYAGMAPGAGGPGSRSMAATAAAAPSPDYRQRDEPANRGSSRSAAPTPETRNRSASPRR